MAKQVGLVRYQGTMGGVRHFKIKGLSGDFAGLKGGPTKEQILSAEEFKRTRENMSEFGGSAVAGKTVRKSLAALVKSMGEPRLTSRLTSVFKRMNLDANGKRGQRPILITQHSEHIKGFNFDKNLAFASVFTANYSWATTMNRNEATLTIPDFNPVNFVNPPAGATHFRIVNGIVSISDYEYNTSTSKYSPKVEANNGLSNIVYSNYLPLDAAVGADTILTASIPGSPVLSNSESLLALLGIEFYQKVDVQYYLFASGNALRVDEVF